MSTNIISTVLRHTYLYFVWRAGHFSQAYFTLFTFYYISGKAQKTINMQEMYLGHSERSTYLLKAGTFSVSCYNYCTWQIMILILAWIKRVMMCCSYRIGPERPLNSLSVCDGGNKTHRTHTEWPLATHCSSPQSFTFMPPWLVATELVRVTPCLCVCMCAAQGPEFYRASNCGHTPSANSTPSRPPRYLVWPQRADMKPDITVGGWQRQLEQLSEPDTPLPSLLSSPLLSHTV